MEDRKAWYFTIFLIFTTMKKIILLFILAPSLLMGQSKVMRNLADVFPEARALVFYYSSLNMLNIEDDPEFAEMISDIEKIKVLIIEKDGEDFDQGTISSIKADLAKYTFEELMTLKNKDYDIGVYIKDDDGDIEGFFFIMDEEESLIAVDLVGSMPVGDVGMLIDKIKQANDF